MLLTVPSLIPYECLAWKPYLNHPIQLIISLTEQAKSQMGISLEKNKQSSPNLIITLHLFQQISVIPPLIFHYE